MFEDDFVIGGFTEEQPSTRPEGFEDESVWRRIEQYIRWRWQSRPVQWTVHGTGLFVPALRPLEVVTVQRWSTLEGGEWRHVTPCCAPFGVELPGSGFFRVAGIAGDDTPTPDDVLEAYERLRDYIAGIKDEGHVGATTISDGVPGVSQTVRRPAAAMARALEYSGAADILKAYRYA